MFTKSLNILAYVLMVICVAILAFAIKLVCSLSYMSHWTLDDKNDPYTVGDAFAWAWGAAKSQIKIGFTQASPASIAKARLLEAKRDTDIQAYLDTLEVDEDGYYVA